MERFVPLKDLNLPQLCEFCEEPLERQFPKIGATHRDEAVWIPSTTEFLKDGEDETVHHYPVTTRGEYNKLMKEKGLHPVG